MNSIVKIVIPIIIWSALMVTPAPAAEQKAVLMITGKSCLSHPKEITDALLGVKGVKTVDLSSMKGHAVVTHDGTVKPEALIEALKKAKGKDGMGMEWACDAEAMP